MKYGYVLTHYGKDITKNKIVEDAIEAENLGFESIWFTDHILLPEKNRLPRYNYISEALITLSQLSNITETIKLGTSTLVLPQRNPIILAKQLATLHYFIENRLILSFGAGWCKEEYNFLNQQFSNRGRRFNEAIEIIRSLWNGKSSFYGEYYSYQDVEFGPMNATLSDLPIYIAGNNKHALNRAIKYGDGWHPVSLSADKIVNQLSEYDLYQENRIGIPLILRRGIGDNEAITYDNLIEPYQRISIDYIIFDPRGSESKKEKLFNLISSI